MLVKHFVWINNLVVYESYQNIFCIHVEITLSDDRLQKCTNIFLCLEINIRSPL